MVLGGRAEEDRLGQAPAPLGAEGAVDLPLEIGRQLRRTGLHPVAENVGVEHHVELARLLVAVRVVVSDRCLKAGTVEVQGRRDAAAAVVPLAETVASVKGRLSA